MTEPRTEAGKRFLARYTTPGQWQPQPSVAEILTIEAEAAPRPIETTWSDGAAYIAAVQDRVLREAAPPPLDGLLVNAIAYALARADLPIPTETSRDYAVRLAPLVIESGWWAAPPPLDGLDVERLARALHRKYNTGVLKYECTDPIEKHGNEARAILAALRDEGETT